MKIKKKLRDVTKEECEKLNFKYCKEYSDCTKCPFVSVICNPKSDCCWIYYKDKFSDKFLNQLVEVEVSDILTKEDKEYLEMVIKPFKDSIEHIAIYDSHFNGYEYIQFNCIDDVPDSHICLKKETMFKNMELNKEYTLKELGLFQKENYKITLTEFFKSTKDLYIHCDTEEKANKLLKAFDKLGKTWNSGGSYLEFNNWIKYKEKTCYDNGGYYSCCDYCNYSIYEFEDIDLEN